MKLIFILLFSVSLFANTFENDIKPLAKNNFKIKQQAISNILQKYPNHDKLIIVLDNMLKGKLYFTKYKKEFVILEKENDLYIASNLFSKKISKFESKNNFKKVKTNNQLRKFIKIKLSTLSIFSKDKEIRLKSIKNIFNSLSKDSSKLLNKALKIEKDEEIKKILIEANHILLSQYGTYEEKINSIKQLANYLSSKTLQTLNDIENNENNEEIKILAIQSIKKIENKKDIYNFIEKVFFGLSLGSVLFLAAIGLSITFGVMGVINMAHGEMIMIGAYTTFTIQQLMPNLIEYYIFIAIPLAFLVSAIVGIIIERLIIRHLYGRPFETLLATFGISLILQQLVRSIYSPLNQAVESPQWMSGALYINDALSITYNRLYIVIFSFMVFLLVLLILKKTSFGLKIRAVTENREIAQAMGIKTNFIDAMTFGLGSGIAGVAGVALSQLTNVGPNLGQSYIIDSFMIVIFGGVGNLWGTFIAAISLGEISKFIEPVAGAVLAKVFILILIILFIQKRPRGLFPKKGRDVDD